MVFFLTSCSFLPFPYLDLLSTFKTSYDAWMILQDEKTTNDKIMSKIRDKDCKTSRAIKEMDYDEYCKEPEEKPYLWQ